MYKLKFILILSIIIVFINFENLFAQKEFNNWYCSKYFEIPTSLTFNTLTGTPKVIFNNQIDGGSPASISDKDGALLFYTNGITIWNKKHQIMENGNGLLGGRQSTDLFFNQTLIVPQPRKPYIYWIFTTGTRWLQFTMAMSINYGGYWGPPSDIIKPFGNNSGLNYTIVDMSKNNGLGAVIEKNIPLMNPCSGQVNSVLHKNRKDVWIVTSKLGSYFSSYLLTENGIETVQYSKFDPIIDDTLYKYSSFGPLVKSLDGKKMASSFNGCWDPYARRFDIRKKITPHFEIYDFDNSTGKLSNRQYFLQFYNDSSFFKFYKDSSTIDTLFSGIDSTRYQTIYCLKLSPDGSKLYMNFFGQPITSFVGKRWYTFLLQFDLTLDSLSMINNCVTLDYSEFSLYKPVTMQIGPDKKIYMADIGAWNTHIV